MLEFGGFEYSKLALSTIFRSSFFSRCLGTIMISLDEDYSYSLVPRFPRLQRISACNIEKLGMRLYALFPLLPRSRKEIEEWSKVMTKRIKELKPLIVCFNGKGTYESYLGDKCDWGLQPEPIPGTSTVSKTTIIFRNPQCAFIV